MTLPVTSPDRMLPHAQLAADKDRRRRPPILPHGGDPFEAIADEPMLDSVAPVSVDAATELAVAHLGVVDAVPLSTAISRYRDEG